MVHNLAGNWHSVDNNKLNIKSDKGLYTIFQNGNDIYVKGFRSGNKGFKNFDYGELQENSDEVTITWTDTHDSLSNEKNYVHACKIKINSTDTKTETIEILYGNQVSFGTWEKDSNSTFQEDK